MSHQSPPKSLADARADLERLADPDSYNGHPAARQAVWCEASAVIRAARRAPVLITARDNPGDAA